MIIQPLIALALLAPATQEAATMKAIRYHEHGPASVLKFEDAPRPTPGEGEMLVRVYAAGVNPVDWKLRAGDRSMAKPYIPGFDVSGVVEQVGPKIAKFKAGDEIF